MAKVTGFLEHDRMEPSRRAVESRIRDFREIEEMLSEERILQQASRCMDCGIPSCHTFGCPLVNRIPDWNDRVYRKDWRHALGLLHATNNFPEITGRICPAPCEAACTLSIDQKPVTIRHIELQIAERGWREGLIKPQPPDWKTGKRVAVIGSGPAGLAAAQQLCRMGHEVVVFEKSEQFGGLLRFGIPDFKLEKQVLDRRLDQLEKESVRFEASVNAGLDLSANFLRRSFQAVLIAAGCTVPRDLGLSGRDLNGIHFAMDFLAAQNRRVSGSISKNDGAIDASGEHVVVIGGGDTGSDCVGTSIRQGALSVTQLEILPQPPEARSQDNPWPEWPCTLKTSSSQEEGCRREWGVLTRSFEGRKGRVSTVRCSRIEWIRDEKSGEKSFREIPDSEFEIKAGLVLLAAGFHHVEHGSLVQSLDLDRTRAGHLSVDRFLMTNVPGVFAAGDCVLGSSLVVKAIHQGRLAADGIHRYLSSS
ncbi:glutamate synthase subunit beta [bacterium]|nr:glutamate synthase subunit beta [bacterium]